MKLSQIVYARWEDEDSDDAFLLVEAETPGHLIDEGEAVRVGVYRLQKVVNVYHQTVMEDVKEEVN